MAETPAQAEAAAADAEAKDRRNFAVVRRAANLPEDAWADERLRAIRATVTPVAATLAQFAIFMATAAKYNLDPLVGELWLADQNGKMLVLTGRNTFLKVANNQKDYRGLSAGVVYEKDKFVATRDGDRVIVKHEIAGFDRGKLVGSWCVVRVEGKADIYIQRAMKDFAHLMGKDNWKKYPDDMVENRSIVAALRRAYNLSGIMEQSEAGDAIVDGTATQATGSEAERAKQGTLEGAAALRDRLERARKPVATVKVDAPEVQEEAADVSNVTLASEEEPTDAELEPVHGDNTPAGPSLQLVGEDEEDMEAVRREEQEVLAREAEQERLRKGGKPREPGED